jgi:hypothetical protein
MTKIFYFMQISQLPTFNCTRILRLAKGEHSSPFVNYEEIEVLLILNIVKKVLKNISQNGLINQKP